MSKGPMSKGPMSKGPMSKGPMSKGPMSKGPMSKGPMSKGPMSKSLMSICLYEDAWSRAEQALDLLLLEVRSSEDENAVRVKLLEEAVWFLNEACSVCG